MMAMKYFDCSVLLSSSLEIDVWRESNLVEDWACCGRGLAYSAAKRGFRAEMVASVDDIPFRERILSISPNASRDVLEFFFRDMKKRALGMNVPEINKDVTLEEVRRSISRNAVPILLINAKALHDEDVPPWIGVRGWNQDGFLIHDPLWAVPSENAIAPPTFEGMMGYGGGQVLVNILDNQPMHDPDS